MSINQLKQQAKDLKLGIDQIREFGKLSTKATWESAIAYHREQMWENGELQTELACLIGHPTLDEGELLDPTYPYEYLGSDDRGLPLAMEDEDGEIYPIEPVHFSQASEASAGAVAEPSTETRDVYIVRAWNDQDGWDEEPADPDDIWVKGDRVQIKSSTGEQGFVVEAVQERFLHGYLNFVIVILDDGDEIRVTPERLWRLRSEPQLSGIAGDSVGVALTQSRQRSSKCREDYGALELEQVTFPIEPYLPVYRVLLHNKTIGRVSASYLGLWGADGNGGISIDRKYLNCIDAAEALIDAKFCESR